MRLRTAHILLLLTLLASLAGCGRRGRVIPPRKLMRLYTEMFEADQWLRDHPDARTAADTTLFFDPIFRRHGYRFADYDRSVHYYLDRPEKFAKLLNRAADRIRVEGARLEKEADKERARREEIEHLLGLHQWQDFSTDSLRWSGRETLWPVFVDPADTVAVQDSVALAADAPLLQEEGSDTWEEVKPVSSEERTAPRRVRIEEKDQR